MRIVCDTNVVVRVLLSPAGPAAEAFRLIRTSHRLLTSSMQLFEVLDVISRPHLAALHGLSVARQRRFVSRLYSMSDIVRLPADLAMVVPGDPKDNPIVLTAALGGANVLCTLDKHFSHPQVVQFCSLHGVRVLTDVELLNELRPS